MRADGRMTTGAQRAEERSLRGHREFGRRIGKRSVDARREGLVIATHLDGEGALTDGGDDLFGIERLRVRRSQAEAVEAGRGQHDRVVMSFAQFAQARVDVAANQGKLEVRTQRLEECAAARARRSDECARGKLFERRIFLGTEDVARIFARPDRGEPHIGR